jgi:periplasmic divalent cation tolerance protein
MLIVSTTFPDFEGARSLAEKIIGNKLAACVQIVPGITSIYTWEGRTHTESEHLMLIKTLSGKFDELEAFITANHSYEVPEIVAVEADACEAYLAWARSVTTD